MKNKNQEALNRVNRAITIALACQGIDLKEDNETVLALKTLQELVDKYEKMKEENKKLKDKATPKKTIKEPIIRDKYRQYKNYCPVCKQELLILGDYCLHCGQKVDWSD